MEKESFIIKMEAAMMVNGSIIKCKEEELFFINQEK